MSLIEEWKEIPDCSGYQVSNLARVRSFRRKLDGIPREVVCTPTSKQQPWYLKFNARTAGGRVKTFRLHRIVAELFIPRTNPKHCVVRHIVPAEDGGSHAADNLQWGTYEDNKQDSVRERRHAFGAKNGNSRIGEATVLAMREEYAKGVLNMKEISLKYGVSLTQGQYILKRKNWSHI